MTAEILHAVVALVGFAVGSFVAVNVVARRLFR